MGSAHGAEGVNRRRVMALTVLLVAGVILHLACPHGLHAALSACALMAPAAALLWWSGLALLVGRAMALIRDLPLVPRPAAPRDGPSIAHPPDLPVVLQM